MAQFVFPQTPINTTGLATEATLLQVETNTADTVTELQTANTTLNTLATEATAAQIEINTGDTVTELQTANTELAAQSASLTSIDSKLTAPLSVTGPLTDAQLRAAAVPVSAASLPLPTGAATETTLAAVSADIDALNARLAGSLVPEEFDYQSLTYVPSGDGVGEIQTVTYRLGGPTGSIVAVLTLAYDSNDRLASVTRS